MNTKTYNAVNTICLLGAVAAVIVFDRFQGSRLVSLILGGAAGCVSTGSYFYTQAALRWINEAQAIVRPAVPADLNDPTPGLEAALALWEGTVSRLARGYEHLGYDTTALATMQQLLRAATSRDPTLRLKAAVALWELGCSLHLEREQEALELRSLEIEPSERYEISTANSVLVFRPTRNSKRTEDESLFTLAGLTGAMAH